MVYRLPPLKFAAYRRAGGNIEQAFAVIRNISLKKFSAANKIGQKYRRLPFFFVCNRFVEADFVGIVIV